MAKGVPYTDAKLKALDIHYADIDPTRGLYHRLVARGRMRTLFTSQDIDEAAHTPPSDTRAYLRGTLMSRWPDEIIGINWGLPYLAGGVTPTNLPDSPCLSPHATLNLK